VRIFEVLGRADASIPPEIARTFEIHERAMELYRRRQWRDALTTFGPASETFPKDMVFRLYAARCRHFLEQPPPQGWDGVFELTEK
jgi:adenylate cyclase